MTTEQKYIVALDQGTTSSRALCWITTPISSVRPNVNSLKFTLKPAG